MGSSFTIHQFSAPNFVLDYQCDLLDPCHQQIRQRLGPNVAAFPDIGKNQVSNEMQECISNANLVLVAEFQKIRIIYWAMFPALILCAIVTMALVISIGPTVYSLIVMGMTAITVLCWILSGRKLQLISEKWRGFVLAALRPKLQDWKTNYPAFTFTIIYPRREEAFSYRSCNVQRGWATGWGGCKRRGQPSLIAIWLYLRITQGPFYQSPGHESVFATTGQQNTQVVIQQPVQPQTVMVQGADGQMVAAHHAMINGQQVLVVNQPPPQQYIQQPQYVQQPQQTEQADNQQQKQTNNGEQEYVQQPGTL